MSYIQIDIRHFAPIRKLTESSSHVEFPNATTIIYNFKDHQGHIYALLRKNWNMKCFQTSNEKWWEYFTWTFGLDVLKMASSVCWWSWCSFRAISFLSNWLSELGLGCLTQLSTIISAISRRLVLLLEKPEYPEKTTDLLHVTDKLYHIMLCGVHLTWAGFELTLVVIGTDCIGSC